MSAREKLLMLWLFVVVIVALAMTHFGGWLVFVMEHCFAAIFPVLRG